ncbi:hypothetical protein E5C33_13540 [Stenotrophomonas maltophilia]|uniref:hypothetical protein n=1 Tax=Stenotrophomonas maltophilia TaxID=40324 RepID=UPI0010767A17|nr:hypothetical protein [Stenotrophomonas maltophilia]TFZ44662.1 hypothetical protein E5C33_13540 [Stenotrophomonas maltophilia]
MNTISVDLTDEVADTRRQVEAYCQTLVDAGSAQWCINEQGRTELHLVDGAVHLLGEFGVTRLK